MLVQIIVRDAVSMILQGWDIGPTLLMAPSPGPVGSTDSMGNSMKGNLYTYIHILRYIRLLRPLFLIRLIISLIYYNLPCKFPPPLKRDPKGLLDPNPESNPVKPPLDDPPTPNPDSKPPNPPEDPPNPPKNPLSSASLA